MNPLAPYLAAIKAALAVLFTIALIGGGAYGMHKWDASRYDKLQAAYTAFVAQTKVAGEQRNKLTDQTNAANQLLKEQDDADNAKVIAGFTHTIAGLRNKRPSSSFVPDAPAGSSRPDLICFDRALYIGADGEFTAEARGLADEGSKATINLDTAKHWAQGIK